jgi:hypothetical protein
MTRASVAVAIVLAWAVLPTNVHAQTTHSLSWTHDGVNLAYFRVTIDAAAPVNVGIPTPAGGIYTWPLPTLSNATHTFVVAACNALDLCAASDPFVVAPPSKPTGLRVS